LRWNQWRKGRAVIERQQLAADTICQKRNALSLRWNQWRKGRAVIERQQLAVGTAD